jgi:hypothetical protein
MAIVQKISSNGLELQKDFKKEYNNDIAEDESPKLDKSFTDIEFDDI